MSNDLDNILIKYKITDADCDYYMIYNSIIRNVRKTKEVKIEHRKQFSIYHTKFNGLDNFNVYMIFIKMTVHDMLDKKVGNLDVIPLESFIRIYDRHLLIEKI